MEELESLNVIDLYSSQEKLTHDVQHLMNLLDLYEKRKVSKGLDNSTILTSSEENYLENIIENKLDAIIETAKTNLNLKSSLFKLVDALKIFDTEFNYTVRGRISNDYLTQVQTPPKSPVFTEEAVQAELDKDEMNEVIVIETINNNNSNNSLKIIDNNEEQQNYSKNKLEDSLNNLEQIRKIQKQFKRIVKEQQKREKEKLISNKSKEGGTGTNVDVEKIEIKESQKKENDQELENVQNTSNEENNKEEENNNGNNDDNNKEDKGNESSFSFLSKLTEAIMGSKQKEKDIEKSENEKENDDILKNNDNANNNNNNNNNDNNDNDNNNSNNSKNNNNNNINSNKSDDKTYSSISKPISINNRKNYRRRYKTINGPLTSNIEQRQTKESFTNPMLVSSPIQSPSQGIYLGKSNVQQTVLSTKIQSIFSKQNTSTRDAECQTESYKVVIRGEDYNIPPGYIGHYAVVPLWTIWVIGYYYKKKTKPKSMWKFLALKTPGLLAKARAQNKQITSVERIN